MRIKVSDILAREVGSRDSFEMKGERPSLDDLRLARDLEGELALWRTDLGLALTGQLDGAVELECHRCLRTFAQPVELQLRAHFAVSPTEDDWPIAPTEQIDLDPLIRQEIIVG